MYDVIVVGAGPAGSVVAKRCAEYGLNTLILEKKRLPRDKVCSGMLLRITETLIRQEFGDIPEAVLCQPRSLLGSMLYVPGLGSQKVPIYNAVTWRRNLDYWMNQKAQAKGVAIWQGARVTGLSQKGSHFLVEMEKDKERREVEARFLIGADGATSIVRSLVFPDLKVNFQQAYEELYQGELELLDKKYYHSFRSVEDVLMRFGVHQKDNRIVIVVAGRVGDPMKKLMTAAKDFLAKNYDFDNGQTPVRKDACVEPMIYSELISHTFLPAKGNALLVGDAGGLINPVIGEGMSVGITSGIFAADAIISASKSGEQVDKAYLTMVENIISIFKETYPLAGKIAEELKRGGHSLLEVWGDVMSNVLRITSERLSR